MTTKGRAKHISSDFLSLWARVAVRIMDNINDQSRHESMPNELGIHNYIRVHRADC